MGVPAVRLSEKSRKRLGLVSAVANFICVIPSLVLFGIGGYIQAAIQDKVDLIRDYSGHFLPPMIISIGFIYLVVNLAGGKICMDNAKPEKRKKMRSVFAIYIYVSTVMCILIILTSIFCFAQIIHLHKAFHNGIAVAMKKYRFNLRLKETIDRLQIEFKCCGNTAYTDWFSTPWIDEQYLALDTSGVKSRLTSGHYLNDDTPFSCCNVDAIRPCIHHRVLQKHYNYDSSEELTLYTTGCRDALVNIYGGQLLTNVGIIILVIAVLQITVVVCARLLQTSALMSIKKHKPTGSADGWLIPWPNPKHDVSSLDDNDSVDDAHSEYAETSPRSVHDNSSSNSRQEMISPRQATLQDQSYSTHGLVGPPPPPPVPPSFGAAFDRSNNHANMNFHNRRRFPVAPPPPPSSPLPPRLPPPPGDSRRHSLLRTPARRRTSPLTLLNRRRENIPFRRQNSRTLPPNIPLYQNGFYRNCLTDK